VLHGRWTPDSVAEALQQWWAAEEQVLLLLGVPGKERLYAACSLAEQHQGYFFLGGEFERGDPEPPRVRAAVASGLVVVAGVHGGLSGLALRRIEGFLATVKAAWCRLLLVGEIDEQQLKQRLPVLEGAEAIWCQREQEDA
jgi:hypothetical protein